MSKMSEISFLNCLNYFGEKINDPQFAFRNAQRFK